MTVVAGFLGDRFSRKWIITLSLIAWSLMTICMGFIGGFGLDSYRLAIEALLDKASTAKSEKEKEKKTKKA